MKTIKIKHRVFPSPSDDESSSGVESINKFAT